MEINHPPILIEKKRIGFDQPVFVIAEVGVNHNGRLDLALKLVDAAAEAGADAVKFQTFRADQVVTGIGEMADYQKKNLGKNESQLEMLKKLELNEKFYRKIIARCKKRGVIFLSTPHGGFESVDLLRELSVPAFKFGSGDLTNLPLLEYAARLKKPIILGTGMATMKEVKRAVNCVKRAGNKKIIALHCTTNYPCPPREVNLKAMRTMADELKVLVGYSDHTLGWQVPVMAAALGARVIEKHFTLDKKMKGPDHRASAEPEEMKEIIKRIREAEVILGSSRKEPMGSEIKIKSAVRKSIVAKKDIRKGERFDMENLAIKRPGTGISPDKLQTIIGRVAKTNISADVVIDKKHFV